MSDLHIGRLVTNSIVANLREADLVTGDGEKPATGAGWSGTPGLSTYLGYVVVHPLSGGITDGPLDGADDDAFPIYQLSTYGATREQCENISDLCRTVMLGTPIVVAGRSVAQVRIDMLGGSRRVDDVQPAEWQGVERYRVVTTPA